MIKAYEGKIIEEDGVLKDILYKCDKKKNIECDKRNCGGEFCNYTKDKRYAIDYAKESNDVQVNIVEHYNNGELTERIVTYKYR